MTSVKSLNGFRRANHLFGMDEDDFQNLLETNCKVFNCDKVSKDQIFVRTIDHWTAKLVQINPDKFKVKHNLSSTLASSYTRIC